MPSLLSPGINDPVFRARYRWQLAWVLLASALTCGLILVLVSQVNQATAVVHKFAAAFTYSVCIGILSSISLHTVGYMPIAQRPGFKLATPVIVLLVTNVVGCLIGGLILLLVGVTNPGEYWVEFRTAAGIGAIFTLTFGLSMYFYQVQQVKLEQTRLELRARQIEEERAHKLAAEARLSSLESRIHPHFLFNTLNSIASLIPKDPKRAEDMVTKLAALLRFSLNANQAGLVPLAQELTVMRTYLEIEKARFGSRLRYSIDVPASLDQLGVPPLALQSLVENSVKHVIAHQPEGGEIQVNATILNGRVHLDVSDSGPGFTLESIPSGHGIHNLSDRLALLYGPEAFLDVIRNGAQATVRITVPRGL